MESKPRTSKSKDDRDDRALQAGLLAHEGTVPSLMVGGTAHSVADLVAMLEGRVDARARTAAARAAWLQAVAEEKAGMAASEPRVSGARRALAVMYAGCNEELGDFGLKVRKTRRALTSEEKAAAVAKCKATRAARHTMGSRQRAKVTGTPPVRGE